MSYLFKNGFTKAYIFEWTSDEPEEDIHMLVRDAGGSWVKITDVILNQAKNKDIVTAEIRAPHERSVTTSRV